MNMRCFRSWNHWMDWVPRVWLGTGVVGFDNLLIALVNVFASTSWVVVLKSHQEFHHPQVWCMQIWVVQKTCCGSWWFDGGWVPGFEFQKHLARVKWSSIPAALWEFQVVTWLIKWVVGWDDWIYCYELVHCTTRPEVQKFRGDSDVSFSSCVAPTLLEYPHHIANIL